MPHKYVGLAFTEGTFYIIQNETPSLLFIDGKTLYPKKQFHSSPSWVCLHLSGTTPPQYLMSRGERQIGHDVYVSNLTEISPSYTFFNDNITGSLTWCLSWWSQWGRRWWRPSTPCSPCNCTACCPGTNQNQTGLALVSQYAPVPPAAPPHGPHSEGPQYHQHCTHEYDILL